MGDVVMLKQKERLGLIDVSSIRHGVDDSVGVVKKCGADILLVRNLFFILTDSLVALRSEARQVSLSLGIIHNNLRIRFFTINLLHNNLSNIYLVTLSQLTATTI
jgi:hypothetical protein